MVVKERIPAAVLWREIVEACGTADPAAIHELLETIAESTIKFWRDNPAVKVHRRNVGKVRERLAALDHDAAHGPQAACEPVAVYAAGAPTADIAALLTEVRDLLRSLLTLDREGRAGETVKSKAKKHGGGAA